MLCVTCRKNGMILFISLFIDYFSLALLEPLHEKTGFLTCENKSNRKAMNRHWRIQKANPAPKTKAGNK